MSTTLDHQSSLLPRFYYQIDWTYDPKVQQEHAVDTVKIQILHTKVKRIQYNKMSIWKYQ